MIKPYSENGQLHIPYKEKEPGVSYIVHEDIDYNELKSNIQYGPFLTGIEAIGKIQERESDVIYTLRNMSHDWKTKRNKRVLSKDNPPENINIHIISKTDKSKHIHWWIEKIYEEK